MTETPPYMRYAALARSLDVMIASESGASEEAETLRDQMDALWLIMSRIERLLALNMAADAAVTGSESSAI